MFLLNSERYKREEEIYIIPEHWRNTQIGMTITSREILSGTDDGGKWPTYRHE